MGLSPQEAMVGILGRRGRCGHGISTGPRMRAQELTMIEFNEENHTPDRGLWRWLGQSARSAVFLRPDLSGLQASPLALLALTLLLVAVGVLLQRAGIAG